MNNNILTRELISNQVVFNFDNTETQYFKVIELLNKWHSYFKSMGLKKGDRYTAYGWHSLELITMLIAGAEYGLQYYCVGSRDQYELPSKKFNPIDYNIKFLFIHSKENNKCYWNIPRGDILAVHTYDVDDHLNINCTPEDILFFAQTSGSTGNPKEFFHTHNSVITAAKEAARLYYLDTDRVLLYTSFNHIGVMSMQTIPVLIAGCYIVGQSVGFSCKQYINDLIKFKPNKIMLFPGAILPHLQADVRWNNLNLDYVDGMITGSTVLPRDFVIDSLQKGIKKIYNVYGLSEALPPVMTSTLTNDNIDSMYDGEYVCNGELVSQWQTINLPNNILGIKGPSLAQADWLTASKIDGFYNTGDIFYKKNEKFWCHGRSDNVIRLNDVLVNLSSIEREILEDDRIKMCKVLTENNELMVGLTLDSQLSAIEINFIFDNIKTMYAPVKIVELECRHNLEQIKKITKFKQ